MKFLGRGLLVATAALLLTALGLAQSSQAQRDQYSWGGFSTADPQFLREAAQDGAAKMQLAYLALQNAQNEQVKSFAVQMLSDYGKVQNDLVYIANQQFVFLTITLDPKQQEAFEALSQPAGRGVRQGLYEGDAERPSHGRVKVQAGSDERE